MKYQKQEVFFNFDRIKVLKRFQLIFDCSILSTEDKEGINKIVDATSRVVIGVAKLHFVVVVDVVVVKVSYRDCRLNHATDCLILEN